ncbi:uncharacterized protein [Chironomus tepperi]|uniref:uncharacterized protein n=1 Tax=Chironomus tepperi TaxID=113505 RepID=UPI00391F604F
MSINIFKVAVEYKSSRKSDKFREIGNNYYEESVWFHALLYYNKSIAYAESKEAVAIGYGNRSAIYYHTKLYKECIENIQLARLNGFPEDKLSRLAERERKCKALMAKPKNKNTEDFWDFYKLSYPAHEKIPWIVNCVEIRHTTNYGRGIYAKQDLKAGDIICVEEPILNYTKEGKGYYQCYNCLKPNAMNLIPCDHTEKAINKTQIVNADVKILSDVAEFFGGYKKFDDYMKRTDLRTLNKSIFDYDFSDPKDLKYEENRMNCLLSLCTNRHPIETLTSIEKLVSKKAAHHLLSLFYLNGKNSSLFDGKDIKFNTGFYISLFMSLINHSCIGNVHSFVVDGKAIVMVEKPVRAGDQLFECYPGIGLIFNKILKKDLEEQHMFRCQCEACTRIDFLKNADIENALINAFKFDPTPIYQQDYKRIKKTLQKARDAINNNPEENRILSNNLIYSVTFIEAMGFELMYPFNLDID